MRIDEVELRVVALPLVSPFVAGHGTVAVRTAVLVHLTGPDGEGWGECAALPEPTYTAEHTAGALLVLREHLVPRLLAVAAEPGRSDGLEAAGVAPALADVVGHPMAKAALELAVLDAEGRRSGRSLARRLVPTGEEPAATVPAGVAVGLLESPDAVAAAVAARVEEGYGRVKLKIAPGRDLDHLRAARDAGGGGLVLSADANGAYRVDGEPGAADDARTLVALDELDLACLEQPLPTDDLLGHAELARRLTTPICLDESLTSVSATRQALDMGACSVVCVKAPRYGSWLAAAEVLDHCRGNGVAAWVGGMLDTGIGRLANLALAAHPGATLPGDLSATARFFADDVTGPRRVEGPAGAGTMAVPAAPGLGAEVEAEALDRLTVATERIRR